MTVNELAFPVLCLARDSSITVADCRTALTRCNALAFFKNRYFDNLLVIDSRGATFRVTPADYKQLSTVGHVVLCLTNGQMDVNLQLSPQRMSFAEVQESVLAWLDLAPEFWEASRDIKEWRDAVREAQSVSDLILLFR